MQPTVVSVNGRPFEVWTNPSFLELSEIGTLVRFTADNKTQNIYVWEFNSGHHGDVSIGLKLEDPYNSLNFLRGHAARKDDGTYEMVGSDFLESFVGRLAGKRKGIFIKLVEPVMGLGGWLHPRHRLASFIWGEIGISMLS